MSAYVSACVGVLKLALLDCFSLTHMHCMLVATVQILLRNYIEANRVVLDVFLPLFRKLHHSDVAGLLQVASPPQMTACHPEYKREHLPSACEPRDVTDLLYFNRL